MNNPQKWQRMTPPLKGEKGQVYISIQPQGRLVLSREAYSATGEPEYAEVFYNSQTRQVMIAPVTNTAKPSPDAFSVKPNRKAEGYVYGVIYCRELIELIVPPELYRAVKVPARLESGNIIFDLPANMLAPKPRRR